MTGDPAQFEAIGNRLGFTIVEDSPERLRLSWQGARFPAFLCVGMAVLLLFISVPILQALHVRGFVGPAGSLWYFPLMNLVLFGIAIFLVTQRRTIEFDSEKKSLELCRRSLYRKIRLTAGFDEIDKITLGIDQVSSGFSMGGSTAAESFPVPALRIHISGTDAALLDRGSLRRLDEAGKKIAARIGKPLEIAPELAGGDPALKP
ncbi:MAG: hypothetical protein HW419_4367 [Deltaproteobacteria bacterium]|nr:hypothetical protein [Deltaproteobacteria bacterium]